MLVGECERVRTGHHELAVGEVDEAEHPEHEADPDRHQRIDRAERGRVDQGLRSLVGRVGDHEPK